MKQTGFKQKKTKPMKRSRLRVAGHSTTAQDKKEIQRLVRLICVYRDGGCILRSLRHCGGEAVVRKHLVTGELLVVGSDGTVIQADHLITRGNSATFADTRLIVCICKGCHGWKKYNDKEYDELVRSILSKERVELWDRCIEARHSYRTSKKDWKLEIINLNQELQRYE